MEKVKGIKDSTYIGINDDDYNLLADKMVEVDDEMHQNIDNQHTELFQRVIDMLQTLCKVGKYVRVKVSKKDA